MLGKLFKYDFKWINRFMPVYFVLLLLVSVFTKIIEYMLNSNPSLLLVIIDKVLVSMFIGCSVSIMITCIMRIWVRFINNIYKDESYLTHTLPVTDSQIFNSKILAGIVSLLISALVIAICVLLVYINKDTIDYIKMMWNSLVEAYNYFFAVGFIGGFVLIIALEILYIMMAGIFGIVVGHCFNNFKMIKSIVAGIGSYFFLSGVSLIVVLLINNFIEYDMIGNGFPSKNYVEIMGVVAILFYLIYNLIYYFISRKIFNRGVNVE